MPVSQIRLQDTFQCEVSDAQKARIELVAEIVGNNSPGTKDEWINHLEWTRMRES